MTADPGDLWPRCSFGRDPRGVHLLKLGPSGAPQVVVHVLGTRASGRVRPMSCGLGRGTLDRHVPQLFVSLPKPLCRGADRGAQKLKLAPTPQKAPRGQPRLAERLGLKGGISVWPWWQRKLDAQTLLWGFLTETTALVPQCPVAPEGPCPRAGLWGFLGGSLPAHGHPVPGTMMLV